MSARCRENKLTSSKNRINRQISKKNKRREILEQKRKERSRKQKKFVKSKKEWEQLPLGVYFLGTYARFKQSYPGKYFGWLMIDRIIYSASLNTFDIYIILKYINKLERNSSKWLIDKRIIDKVEESNLSFDEIKGRFISCNYKISIKEFNQIKKTKDVLLCN